ncbi:MAG TPA: hypothetical protein VK762_33970, partial [Polyangiaceae bacterium]|nr:hypothetical protein [Polyangiaceae bacterium]
REILGKDTVNDEDIWQLERQGRFADLTPGSDGPASANPARANPVSATVRPPAMPDPGLPTRGPPVPTGVTPPPSVTTAETPSAPAK